MESAEVVSLGKSIIVPSVQELTKQPITQIPPRYLRFGQDPPVVTGGDTVPVIDLQRLLLAQGGDGGDFADSELDRLHLACKEWGFFQIINHGVSTSLLEEFKSEIENFFKLPYEEKKKLWQQPDNHEGFGQLFVVSDDQKLDWSDMFYISTLPYTVRKPDLFAKLPSNLRDTIERYSDEVKSLAMTILDYMAKALNMDGEEIREMFCDGLQSMRMNYYPPCPKPDMAIGFTPHSDADALTVLFQLNETEGLQIRKDGKWIPIRPLPGALVVNVGDIMEIVSNGVYRSIEHRATVNLTKERLSVATFYSCSLGAEIGPAVSLVGPDKPPVFRRVPAEIYFTEFFARKLNGKAYIDFMKVEYNSNGGEI